MYCIIFNPTAGAGRSLKTLQKIEKRMNETGVRYDVFETKYKEHATELAKNASGKGYDGIVSVGGDGTLLEIVQALHGTEETLGIIPAGTGNDFREAVRVPADPLEALDIILAGNKKRIDLGLINGRKYFLNVAGTGFDVDVLKNTNRVRRFFTGGFAYYLGIVMSLLGYKNLKIRLTLDGETIEREILLVAFANGKCYGGGLQISPDSDVQDGLLNVTILNSIAKRRILIELPKLKRGELEKIDVAERFICKKAVIECEKKQTFNLDGDIYGETPMTFSIEASSLFVFCP